MGSKTNAHQNGRRPDDLRDLPEWRIGRKTKPEGREILLCDILAYPRTEIGKQVAQFLPPLPSRRNHAVALQKQSKVISQAAVNSIFEGERQNLWTDFPLSDATGERILIQTSYAAWNGGCR